MAFDRRNDVFYKTFKGGDSKTYTVYFYPGHNLDIVSENLIEFPDDVMFNKCESDAGLPDKLPWGLELAQTLNLEFFLKGFDNTTWGEVATWIIESHSTAERTVNGIPMYIPNRWKLYNNTDTRIEFDGFQSVTNKEKLKIDANGEYKLECISKIKTVYELCDVSLVNFGTAYHTRTNENIYDVVYKSGAKSIVFAHENYAGFTYSFYRIRDIFQGFRYYSLEIFRAFIRDGMSFDYEMFDIDGISSIWNFFKQEILTDESHPYIAGALGFPGLMVCGKMDFDGEDRGGFLMDSSGIKSYNNAWSFLRQFCESFMLKVRFVSTGGNVNYPRALFYKVFDTIGTNQNITATDKNELEIDKHPLLVTQASCYITGGNDGDNGQITLNTITGNLDGDSDESELMFNNYLLGYFKTEQFNSEFQADGSHRYEKHNESIRTLYYKELDGSVYKVHEHCTYDLGGGVTPFTSDTSYTSINYPSFYDDSHNLLALAGKLWQYFNFVNRYKERLPYYGMAYIRNRVIKYIRGNKDHCLLEGTLSNSNGVTDVSMHHIGNTYDISIASMTNITAISNYPSKGIMTACKYDYIKGEAKVSFFLRGDS